MFSTCIDRTEALLCGFCHLGQCVSECVAMGNKIVIFTEEQFEDYQVSDTHISIQAPGLLHLYLISPTRKPCGNCGIYQIHTSYYECVGFHINEYLD
jgi:hypothetical protein